jgi:plastocyanin
MRRVTPLLLASLAVILTAGPTSAAVTYRVDVGDDYFDPTTRSIARGDTVRWRNVGDRTHTVTLSNNFNFFPSQTLGPGQAFPKVFPAAGTFGYLCVIHPGQSGRVKVPLGLAKVGGTIRIRLASASVSGFRHRIEKQRNGGAWTFLANTSATAYFFTPPAGGTWTFRARLESLSNGSTSGWAKKSINW